MADDDAPVTVADIREWLDDVETNLDNEYDTRICAAIRDILDTQDEDTRTFARWINAGEGSHEERAAGLLAARLAGRIAELETRDAAHAGMRT